MWLLPTTGNTACAAAASWLAGARCYFLFRLTLNAPSPKLLSDAMSYWNAPTGGDLWAGPAPAADPFGAMFAPAPAPAAAGTDIFGNPSYPARNAAVVDPFAFAPAPAMNAWAAPAPALPAYGNVDIFGAPASSAAGMWGAPTPAPAPAVDIFGPPMGAPSNNLFGTAAPAPAGGDVFGGGVSFLGQPARDLNQDKWPRCADMRGTIYGCTWFDANNLLLGDASGDFRCLRIQPGQPFKYAFEINQKEPIVSIAANSQMTAGVFTADPKGNVIQWDLASKKSNPKGALGQSMAMEFRTGVLAVGSWASHIAVVDVRNNKPTKIAVSGKVHCVDINGHVIYAGVNRDPQNMAVLLYDLRNTSKPMLTHRVEQKEGLVRCIMRRGTQNGFMYGTRNGFVGLNLGGNQARTTVLSLAETFKQHPSPALMVSSIAFNPSDQRTYIAVSNGRILKESSGKLGTIKFNSSTSLSRIAFSPLSGDSSNYMAVCRSYNYFDNGESKRNGTAYPYNEVFIRHIRSSKK
jgi:hypothetical protein